MDKALQKPIIPEILKGEITPRTKTDFLNDCMEKHRELFKYQRLYKRNLSKRLQKRAERILQKNQLKTIQGLRDERNNLRAQLYVSDGFPHSVLDKRALEQIECHVQCQEHLADDIRNLKHAIANLEHEKSRNERKLYELNRKTVPDAQHQVHVQLVRKRLDILKNRLEVKVGIECKFSSQNATVREEMQTLLNQRRQFNAIYEKLVQALNTDKKYLIRLCEYVTNTLSDGIDRLEKITNTKRKSKKESEQIKMTVRSLMRNFEGTELAYDFLLCKTRMRHLAELQPQEIQRRENFKRNHTKKIELYNKVLDKVREYTKSMHVFGVIEKYQQQESLYYTYFSYANEASYHISFLETAVERLYRNIYGQHRRNIERLEAQEGRLNDLEDALDLRLQRRDDLKKMRAQSENDLKRYFQQIFAIFHLCNADGTPMLSLLGEQHMINLYNVHGFMKILEERLLRIVRQVYVVEHAPNSKISPQNITVKFLEKFRDAPTNLNAIVLTQQCAECAEGETVNIDNEGDGGVAVMSVDEIKARLAETVKQPDMQYRLHNLSQCRLPRSRLLAAKRNA